MAHDFTMPKLGLTMTEGTIREWVVADGTRVKVGDPVLIIETDKVETEVEAREAGILSISGTVGKTYVCGAVIARLLADGEADVARVAAPPVAAPPAPVGTDMADRDDTADRDEMANRDEMADRILASPMARAAARNAGIDLAHISGTGPGGRIVADDVARFAETEVAVAVPPPAVPPPAVPTVGGVAATAGGRMLAELVGIDLRLVPAATPGARVTREDVAAWIRQQLDSVATESSPDEPPTPAAIPDSRPTTPLLQKPVRLAPLRGMRGVIAERMHASLTDMAQLTLSVDADMSAVNAERTQLELAELPVPGYTAWVIAAASRALADHPYVNSQVTADGVAHLPAIHLGVAVALDQGLIVPVIKHANTRSVDELQSAVADLAARARDGKLALDEVEGGTFSVTALGMFGVDMFTPIVNPPNAAILGIGRLRTVTRWDDGVPSPTTVMTLSLTWDHRAFDGAPAAEFAQSIVRYLENPAQLNG